MVNKYNWRKKVFEMRLFALLHKTTIFVKILAEIEG
jgi:hypothetical protein